jgi:DNA-binding transcriptional MerR regulator
MAGMTIGKLAAAGGVGVETIRYYQRRGLLQEPPRDEFYGGIRRYGAPDVQRLRFIRAAQGAGFTLEQIAELLELDATDDRARARALPSGSPRSMPRSPSCKRRAQRSRDWRVTARAPSPGHARS